MKLLLLLLLDIMVLIWQFCIEKSIDFNFNSHYILRFFKSAIYHQLAAKA